MPFFSIIIPVYNVEDYLERCLNSILNDTCRDLELILVDDGSTDGSGKICDKYAEENVNISVIHKQNGGLSSARNAGLEKASGEWVSFVDSDDYVDHNSYQTMKDILIRKENSSAEIVKLGYKKVSDQKFTVFVPCVEPGIYDKKKIREELIPAAFGNRCISDSTINTVILSSCAHLYKRQFLLDTRVRFVSEREVGSEDFLFLYSLYLRASRILATNLIWYNYDTREGSLTRRYRKDLYEQYKKLGNAVYLQLKETELDTLYKEDFAGLFIALMYVCIMNECFYPGDRGRQIKKVKKILNNKKLQACLRLYHANNIKSLIIAKWMQLKLALPLCMIQWKNAGKTV